MDLAVAILAGGLATRLGSITAGLPKSLVEVAGQPFIVHQLALLHAASVRRVVLCVGHLGELIEDRLGPGDQFGLDLSYVYDGDRPLGTGGALRKALPLLGERFLTLYGDSYLDCDYAAVARAFVASGKLGQMTVLANAGRWDKSNVVYRDGAIVYYGKEDGQEMAHIDYGLGAFSRRAFADHPVDEQFDLASIWKELCARGELAAYEVRERFYEIGSRSGLAETEKLLEEL
jgi:NDP-sugar pyrophosphorylase family protein